MYRISPRAFRALALPAPVPVPVKANETHLARHLSPLDAMDGPEESQHRLLQPFTRAAASSS
ncbi:hypothetical protein ACLESO_02775 [Pyxidicoccus sp. 3LG]